MAKTNHWGALAAAAGTLVAVGLLMLIMVVVEAGPAEATFPVKNGRIAYNTGANSCCVIYTINPDGGGRVQVTDNNVFAGAPSYSPDGKRIAYSGEERLGGYWRRSSHDSVDQHPCLSGGDDLGNVREAKGG
jgi:hypothetical protein